MKPRDRSKSMVELLTEKLMPSDESHGRVDAGSWVCIAEWRDPAITMIENNITGNIECVDISEITNGRIKNSRFVGFPLYVTHVMPPFVHGVLIDPTDGQQHRLMLDSGLVSFCPLPADTIRYTLSLVYAWARSEGRGKKRRAMRIFGNCDLIAAMAQVDLVTCTEQDPDLCARYDH